MMNVGEYQCYRLLPHLGVPGGLGDIAMLLLACLIFYLCFRNTARLPTLCVLFFFLLHELYALSSPWIDCVVTGFTNSIDNIDFVDRALGVQPSHVAASYYVYIYMIKKLAVLNVSWIGLQQLSIIGYLLCCYMLLKFCELLEIVYPAICIILFSILPLEFLIMQQMYREPYIILILMVILYQLACFVQDQYLHRLLVMFCAGIVLYFLHRYGWLMLFAMYAGIIATVVMVNRSKPIYLLAMFSVILSIVLLCFTGQLDFILMRLQAIINHYATIYAQHNTALFLEGGTSYLQDYDLSKFNLFNVPLLLLHYFMAPFIWQVNSVISFYSACIGMYHFVIIVISSWVVMTHKHKYYNIFATMYITAILIAMLFAIGTLNYGTAQRHNMLTEWMFLLIAMYGVQVLQNVKNKDISKVAGAGSTIVI